jgi:hypothetical protein
MRRIGGRGAQSLIPLTVVAGVLLAACETQPRVPTLAGVVAAINPTTTQAQEYVTSAGNAVIDLGRDERLYGGGSPRVGDLLVVGGRGSETWYLVVTPGGRSHGRECYRLFATGLDVGNAIDLNVGVRLAKTADFDRGPDTDGKYVEQPNAFCVDGRGAIFAWG